MIYKINYFVLAFLFIFTLEAIAKGDYKILLDIIQSCEANINSIQTWQGTIYIEDIQSDLSDQNQIRSSQVKFYINMDEKKLRTEYAPITFDQEEKKVGGNALSIFTNDSVMKYLPPDKDLDIIPTLSIDPPGTSQPDRMGDCVDPMQCMNALGGGKYPLKKRIGTYYKWIKDGEMVDGYSINKKGKLIQLRAELYGTVNSWTFDINKQLRIVKAESSAIGKSKWLYEWEWISIDGIDVPAKLTISLFDAEKGRKWSKKPNFQRIFKFSDSTLNQPIDPTIFTLEGIGIPKGTWVTNNIAGLSYTFGAPDKFAEIEIKNDISLTPSRKVKVDEVNSVININKYQDIGENQIVKPLSNAALNSIEYKHSISHKLVYYIIPIVAIILFLMLLLILKIHKNKSVQ